MSSEGRITRVVAGPADLSFVEAVLDALSELWTSAPHVPEEDRTLFMLAVSEIATNVVQHGDGGTTVRMELKATPAELCAVILDSAAPVEIDWDDVALPDADAESGRGLALAVAVLDELRHERRAHGNSWTLRRGLRGAEPGIEG